MPRFRTQLINSVFDVTDDGALHATVDAASKAAILAAIDVAKGLYADGEERPTIEVVIHEGELQVARHFVTLIVDRAAG